MLLSFLIFAGETGLPSFNLHFSNEGIHTKNYLGHLYFLFCEPPINTLDPFKR